MGKNSEVYEGKINGLIDRGCSMDGKLSFDGSVQINGNFQGEIISDGILIVGPDAKVDGNIQVGSIIIEGNVQGTIVAGGRIELRKGSRLIADIRTTSIVIEEGAAFHGQCQMLDEGVSRTGAGQVVAPQQADSLEETGDSLMM